MITLASLENQTSNRTAGNTQLMRTASNLSLNTLGSQSRSQSLRVPESADSGNEMGWFLVDFIKVTSEKQPSQALNQPLILFISPSVV